MKVDKGFNRGRHGEGYGYSKFVEVRFGSMRAWDLEGGDFEVDCSTSEEGWAYIAARRSSDVGSVVDVMIAEQASESEGRRCKAR